MIHSALNKAFRDWGDIFGSATVAAALADRLVANSEVIILERSFRSKHVMADS
jgi:DNA replication protein DnaC